jgi:hypothetical protein
MTLNRELFHRDPTTLSLANDGVARVSVFTDPAVAAEELSMFVCEGQYEAGLSTVLQTFINHMEKSVQPSAWVSGFFGSGKSHLVKVLRYLWTNELVHGKRARDLANLPPSITDLLKELDTRAKTAGGLFACAGVLEVDDAPRLPGKIAGIVLSHLGLPSDPATARFVLRLRQDGLEETLRAELGSDWTREVEDFRVSTVIGEFLAKNSPALGKDAAAVLTKLNANYPPEALLTIDGMVKLVSDAVTQRFGSFPCTLLVLDEAQQYIGKEPDRQNQLQGVTEALSSRLKGRLIVVATGQSALNTTELLRKLQDRFTRQIQLQDKDIDTVIRNVVLRKEPSKRPLIEQCVSSAEGEISRQLKNSRLETVADDKSRYVDDYPVLPVRRRFWERFLRSVETGLTGQLRTQLRLTLEAVQKIANQPLGTIIPADALFDQISTIMVENGVLDGAKSNDIQKLLTAPDANSRLKGRLCALIFMIHRLPREQNVDLGVRATADTLADLLVDDLVGGGHALRQRVPELLQELVKDGMLMQVGDEFRQQTTESAQWDQTFQRHFLSIKNSPSEIPNLIGETLRAEMQEVCDAVRIKQGRSKTPRSLSSHFTETPPPLEDGVTVWVRTGWETAEKSFVTTIESRGANDPLVAVYVGKQADTEFRDQLATAKAAMLTLAERGAGAHGPAAIEARSAIVSKQRFADDRVKNLLANEILPKAKVFLSGSTDHAGIIIDERITSAANASLARLFPQFHVGDSEQWEAIFRQAKAGQSNPLAVLGYNGSPEDHPVCKAVHAEVGAGKRGSELRKKFSGQPWGWPSVTVDGAVMVLLASELLKASKNHTPVTKASIELSTLGAHDFRTDAPPVTVQQKMRIKGVCAAAGVTNVGNDDLDVKATEALKKLEALAANAGGDAPLPPPPSTQHIKAILGTSGNAMLSEIDTANDTLRANAEAWRTLATLKAQRLPKWQTLQDLLAAARDAGLPQAEKVAAQVDAIRANRQLLSEPDNVPLYIRDLSTALTDELKARHATALAVHDQQSATLAATAEWSTLGAKDLQARDVIAADNKLAPLQEVHVADADQLATELRRCPLSRWSEIAQALPTRFAKARADAARALQPKAQSIALPTATINNKEELTVWLTAAEKAITAKLAHGPVIV